MRLRFSWWSVALVLGPLGQFARADAGIPGTVPELAATVVRFDSWVARHARLWPGFAPGNLPVAVTDSSRHTLVAHLDRRPAGFSPVASARSRMWARTGPVPGLSDARRLEAILDGRKVAVVPVSYLQQDDTPPERRLLLPLFLTHAREHFPHFSEYRTGRHAASPISMGLDNRVLLAIETRILLGAWGASDLETRRASLASWAAVRRARLQLLPTAESRREILAETFDGLTHYMEAQALEPESQREGRLGARMMGLLRADTATTGGMTVRRGASGAMVALLLDRVRFDSWKGLVTGGLTLSECVERQSGVDATVWESLFEEARRVHRFAALREQLQAEDRNSPPGYQAFQFEGEGKIVLVGLKKAVDRGEGQIDWSRPGGEWFRLLGPTPPLEIDARTLLGQRLEGLHYRRGEVDVQLGPGPVLMRSEDVSWPCHQLTYHDDLSRLRLLVDGRPVSWSAPGTGYVRELSIQSPRGRVRVAGRGQIELVGRTLTITPAP